MTWGMAWGRSSMMQSGIGRDLVQEQCRGLSLGPSDSEVVLDPAEQSRVAATTPANHHLTQVTVLTAIRWTGPAAGGEGSVGISDGHGRELGEGRHSGLCRQPAIAAPQPASVSPHRDGQL